MFKLFHKKLNKKGFTLAEMLIVVAIIAILVAIAIPIFTSSLDKAHKAAKDANIRSVKAAAIYTILDQWDNGKKYGAEIGDKAPAGWVIDTAYINEDGKSNGQIKIDSISAKDADDLAGVSALTYTTDPDSGKITITNIVIKSVDLPT